MHTVVVSVRMAADRAKELQHAAAADDSNTAVPNILVEVADTQREVTMPRATTQSQRTA